jgi:solute carrier family 25 S-adenosylmethionine transporter 26
MKENREPTFTISLLGGGIAGTTVDVALFPIDTIKTRLQSPQGFLKAGGFKGVYKGLSAAAVGSAPGASLFFATYEMAKQQLLKNKGFKLPEPVVHMTAAAMGEMVRDICFGCELMVLIFSPLVALLQSSTSYCRSRAWFASPQRS